MPTDCDLLPDACPGLGVREIPALAARLEQISLDPVNWVRVLRCRECGQLWEERFRETGLIAFETLIDANIVGEVVKLAANRARPTEGNGRGQFGDSPNGRWNSSFPSGHAINTWALASVIAHEYPKPVVYVIVYGLATTVVAARVGARRHFPGDVLAGGAAGWFIGDYVYGRRHNRALDHKPPVARRILDRVHIGATFE